MPASRRSVTVLIADDDAAVRDSLVELFHRTPGFTIAEIAADGLQAIAGGARSLPDVALVDLRMPGASGLEVIQALRAASPCTGAVLHTAHLDSTTELHATRAGAFACVAKGTHPSELLGVVAAAAAAPRGAGEALDELVKRVHSTGLVLAGAARASDDADVSWLISQAVEHLDEVVRLAGRIAFGPMAPLDLATGGP